MNPFKVGDKVECIRPNHPHLNSGEIYTVKLVAGTYSVQLFGVYGTWDVSRFKKVEEPVSNPHPHRDLIIAWANGAKIQWFGETHGAWFDAEAPTWCPDYSYRIKPEPKPDRVGYLNIVMGVLADKPHEKISPMGPEGNNVKCTFDGETGKLKDVELIK